MGSVPGPPWRAASDLELQSTLEGLLADALGSVCRIVRLQRQSCEYYSSFPIEELDVVLNGGRELALMFKDLSDEALLDDARRARPNFLYDPRREMQTYQHILADLDLGTARWYGSVADVQRRRYWLFLERVQAVPLWQVEHFAVWLETARWLGTMHRRFADDPAGPSTAAAAGLPRLDRTHYRLWMDRALAFADEPSTRRPLEWLAQRYDRVVEYLDQLPVTLMHGEFYASNILVQEQSHRICPVDWEMAAVGPGLMDLAALTAGAWGEAEKSAMVMAYQEALAAMQQTLDELLTGLDYCQLYAAVRWLGWSNEWTPPPERARDWGADAMHLAEKLGL